MGKPYAQELATLDSSLRWSRSVNIDIVRDFAVATSLSPLIAVGSGGSCTAAHFAALLHRHYAKQPARSATPLELLLEDETRSAVLMISASGRNQDVRRAARRAQRAEVPALGSVTTSHTNPLTREVQSYCRGFAFADQVPTGKDGFLATNSLAATLVILARARGVDVSAVSPESASHDLAEMASRTSAVVLHAGWASPIATDLESRLHESTLLNVQVSDYRNFGHGRHLWLARRSAETTVLALVTPEIASLANRTLKLIPPEIPVVRLQSSLSGPAASIDLLIAVLHWTGALAQLRSIDPGRPHVPDFGRRLFQLRPPRESSPEAATPVHRKLARFAAFGDSTKDFYSAALEDFKLQLAQADFGAVALDYDGTLCATSERFGPLPEHVASACNRLLDMGLRLGIATGRGKSVREALRAALPKHLWDSVIIGYYNGSDVAPLSDDNAPDKRRPPDEAISSVAELLVKDPILSALAVMEVRPSQITISPRQEAPATDLYTYVADLLTARSKSLLLMRSGHSIDLVAPHVSKMGVVDYLRRDAGPKEILCIGDRGAWPGNDAQLLSQRFSLSVDEVSSNPDSCWNLAPAGELGTPATLRYLNALEAHGNTVRFTVNKVVGGSS